MANTSTPSAHLSLRSVLEESTDGNMNLVENRLATFEHWPLTGECVCTPPRMAEAGFYHCPTESQPDLARCYVCFKELHGWQPSDDPFEEHSRYADCAFVSRGMKKGDEMTLHEFTCIEKERDKNRVRMLKELRMSLLEEDLQSHKRELEKLLKKR
ncbi:hypothetical protein HPB50_015118 [Hyalomma asiaticum]|uniref:Uncharacterized protein n=1 Tax=Hyalomma asiaticum TaxID=266040 RepID=A0ACB7T2P7_HYAAI|nr:hypothetical protein HPB50_015118 [Hyalomma asiaticum]